MRTDFRKIYKRKVDSFYKSLKSFITLESIDLEAVISAPGEFTSFDKKDALQYENLEIGKSYGNLWDYAWINAKGLIPEKWAGNTIYAKIILGNECLIFDSTGCPLYGLSNDSIYHSGYHKDLFPLFDVCKGGEPVELWIQAASAHWMAANPISASKLQLCIFNNDVWHLWLETGVLMSIMEAIDESSPRWNKILSSLNKAASIFCNNPSNASTARKCLEQVLQATPSSSDLTAYAVGHAHIDTAWLWPVKTTVGKILRTFASQIWLLDHYPTYTFGASSPYHYEIVKQYAPLLYEKIGKYVKEGRWEVQGGMYVEADCNLISGESMIRQIVIGKNFFMDEFGIDVKNLWLPDVFGYSAAMPQIMKKSGIDYFVTQKISWNEVNKFPLTTFNWRGIDGSVVLVHFPPENSYSSELFPSGLIGTQKNLVENDILDEFLSLYGMGDGGGGPKEDMIERGLMMQNLESCPKVKFTSADSFFKAIEKKRKDLETWTGELYLEYHRGTYTTQANVKKLNRSIEQLLTSTEMLYSCLPTELWPSDRLSLIWKKLLVNQFHDIIPGSSVPEVYVQTLQEYHECITDLECLQKDAALSLFIADDSCCVLFNPHSFVFTAPVKLPQSWKEYSVTDNHGNHCLIQESLDESIYCAVRLDANSFTTIKRGDKRNTSICDKGTINTDNYIIENDLIRYTIDKNAMLISAFDKEEARETIDSAGKCNVFTLYSDLPTQYEAWDIDISYPETPLGNQKDCQAGKTNTGSLFNEIKFTMCIGNSSIEQIIILNNNSKRLDFKTRVNWNEQRKMLRVSFTHKIDSDYANFDIQSGFVSRSTRKNSNEDVAKFESVAHKFVDCSENNYGVALLNNCKYGYHVADNIIDLNLLRSPMYPDESRALGFTDKGLHEFTYSFLPHSGSFVNSSVQNEASMLNLLPFTFDRYVAHSLQVPIRVAEGTCSISTIKRAEKDNSIIVRVTETSGSHSKGKLILAKKFKGLIETDLMEWQSGGELYNGNELILDFSPFEIKTFKMMV